MNFSNLANFIGGASMDGMRGFSGSSRKQPMATYSSDGTMRTRCASVSETKMIESHLGCSFEKLGIEQK